jgi:GDPmannose 4,6-dehydratase
VDPRYFRPTEVETLLGDASKARRVLGWSAEIGFDALVSEMAAADWEIAKRDAAVARAGFRVLRNHE